MCVGGGQAGCALLGRPRARVRSATATTRAVELLRDVRGRPDLRVRRPRAPRGAARMSGSPRTGIGYDSHRFGDVGGRLVLGGVEIPGERGLAGHSDADVVAHARDRRAARGGRAGRHRRALPGRRPALRRTPTASSCWAVARHAGRARAGASANVDVTVIAERPRLGAVARRRWRSAWRGRSASSAARVNVKATTNEGMGFVGRGEGIAALAVAQIERAASDA